ncbi:hypothetical protein SCOR_26740 [Sulfidibacter corallicola]|uniref:Uncharacterized protein n=1 Tax=Sulfidibacter corallicola TaxID=2818388 RepID=A0A8A4TPF1_SULCO|nr:hypothetical protein [Sulfidibacter corallicola]QTD50848.1 hypothetical protein J3U87_00135 [Sulfidibacter corallicola]
MEYPLRSTIGRSHAATDPFTPGSARGFRWKTGLWLWILLVWIPLPAQSGSSAPPTAEPNWDEVSDKLCKIIRSRNADNFSQELMRLQREMEFNLIQDYNKCDCEKRGAFSGGSLLRAATYYRSIEVVKIIFVELLKNPDGQRGLAEYLNHRELDGMTLLDWVRQRVEFLSKNDRLKAQLSQSVNYMIGYRKRGAKFSCELLEESTCEESYQEFLDRIVKR